MFMRQLTYLVALDKHRHFGRAAESCNVSQPALSSALSELERELGVTIVKRNRSFQGLTAEGERVIAWARQVLASLEGLRQEAHLGHRLSGGHLAIGAVPSAIHPVALLSAECRNHFEGLTLAIRSLSTQDMLRQLKDQELHIGLTYDGAVSDETFDVMPIFTERYVLIADEQASLPRNLTWAEVATYPLSLLSQEMQNRKILNEAFAQAGVTPNVVVESNAIRILLDDAREGRAYSIMPLSALPAPYAAGLRIHTIAPEHAVDICLIRLKRDAQPPLTEAAWRLAKTIDFQSVLDRPLG